MSPYNTKLIKIERDKKSITVDENTVLQVFFYIYFIVKRYPLLCW